MNPQLDPSQGLHLPQPAPHQPQQATYAAQPNINPTSQQFATGQYAYMAPTSVVAQTPPATQPVPVNVDQQAASHEPVGADDPGATLDEEWINRAREAVGLHQSDPYNQSKELSKIKAEYLKDRYNKEIKTSKDQSQ